LFFLSQGKLRDYFLVLLQLADHVEPLIEDDKFDSFVYLVFYFFMLHRLHFQVMCHWFFFHLSLISNNQQIYLENNHFTKTDYYALFKNKLSKSQKENIGWSGYSLEQRHFVEHPPLRYEAGFPNSVAQSGPWKNESPWGHFSHPLIAIHNVVFHIQYMPSFHFAALRFNNNLTPLYHIFALNDDLKVDRVTLITSFAQLDAVNQIRSAEFCPQLSEEYSADCCEFDDFLVIDDSERWSNRMLHDFLSNQLHSLDTKLYAARNVAEFDLLERDRSLFTFGSNSVFDLHFTLELKEHL